MDDSNSVLESILELIKSLTNFSFDSFFNMIKNGFHSFFSWIYDFIFVDLFSFSSNLGHKFFGYIFSNFSSSALSLDFVFFFIGVILVILILRLIISILRG